MPKPSELTLAIRDALRGLNDVDASSEEVKSKVLELHPELKGEIGERFSAQVSAQRRWLREAGEEPQAPSLKEDANTTYQLYQLAQRFWEKCGGNTTLAGEILGFLEQVDVEQLRRAFDGWKQLVAAAGGQQNARRILEIQKQTGMIR